MIKLLKNINLFFSIMKYKYSYKLNRRICDKYKLQSINCIGNANYLYQQWFLFEFYKYIISITSQFFRAWYL